MLGLFKPTRPPLATTVVTFDSPTATTNGATNNTGNNTENERTFTEEQFSTIVRIATMREQAAANALELEHRLTVNERTSRQMERFDTPNTIRESTAYKILGEIGLANYAKEAIDTTIVTRSKVDEISALLGAVNSREAVKSNVLELRRRASAPEIKALELYLSEVKRAINWRGDMIAFTTIVNDKINAYQGELQGAYDVSIYVANMTIGISRHEGSGRWSKDERLDKVLAYKEIKRTPDGSIEVGRVQHSYLPNKYSIDVGNDSWNVPILLELHLSKQYPDTGTGDTALTPAHNNAIVTIHDPAVFVTLAPELKALQDKYCAMFPVLKEKSWCYIKDFCEEKLSA